MSLSLVRSISLEFISSSVIPFCDGIKAELVKVYNFDPYV